VPAEAVPKVAVPPERLTSSVPTLPVTERLAMVAETLPS
jgi:hypothetical protein